MDFTIHYLPEIHIDLPFQSPLFRSEYYSFLFVKDGIGSYTIDEKIFSIKPNTFYFTNPGHIRSFQIDTCVDVYMLTINESFLIENLEPDLFDRFPFLLAEVVPPSNLSDKDFQKFEPLYKATYAEFQGESKFKNDILAKLFVALLLKIKALYFDSNTPVGEIGLKSKIVNGFKKLLDSEFKKVTAVKENYQALNVQDYATKLNLHPNYFNTVIKAKSGKTAYDWIQERTLSAAKSLLKNTSFSAKIIAFKLGYSEATHFSRFFKKMTNQSPMEYRKSVQA